MYRNSNAHHEAWADINKRNKDTLFSALAAAEITSVEVEFDGWGDDGQTRDLVAYRGNTITPIPSSDVEIVELGHGSNAKVERQSLDNALRTFCVDALHELYPGWEIDEGSAGRFTFDVQKRLVNLIGDRRYVEYEPFEEEV
jgi:Family of unknown function (DUF6878)